MNIQTTTNTTANAILAETARDQPGYESYLNAVAATVAEAYSHGNSPEYVESLLRNAYETVREANKRDNRTLSQIGRAIGAANAS